MALTLKEFSASMYLTSSSYNGYTPWLYIHIKPINIQGNAMFEHDDVPAGTNGVLTYTLTLYYGNTVFWKNTWQQDYSEYYEWVTGSRYKHIFCTLYDIEDEIHDIPEIPWNQRITSAKIKITSSNPKDSSKDHCGEITLYNKDVVIQDITSTYIKINDDFKYYNQKPEDIRNEMDGNLYTLNNNKIELTGNATNFILLQTKDTGLITSLIINPPQLVYTKDDTGKFVASTLYYKDSNEFKVVYADNLPSL